MMKAVTVYNTLIYLCALIVMWMATGTWQTYLLAAAGLAVTALRIRPHQTRTGLRLSKQLAAHYIFLRGISEKIENEWHAKSATENWWKAHILWEMENRIPEFIKNGHVCDENCKQKAEGK